MSIVFGNFIEADDHDEYICLAFCGKNYSLQERWRNNGIAADFLADYWLTFFQARRQESSAHQRETRGIIAYVANELLENSVKFRNDDNEIPISFKVFLSKRGLRFYVTNSLSVTASRQFQAYIRQILAHDSGTLYLQQLEQNASCHDNSISRLGLLTLLHDYHVQLAWKFEEFEISSPLMTVTVMAILELPFEKE